MRQRWRKNPERTSLFLYIFITGLLLMICWHLLGSLGNLGDSISWGLQFVLGLLTPFLIALLLAYFLTPLVDAVEALLDKILRKQVKSRMKRRVAALAVVYVLVVGLMGLMIGVVVPNIYENIQQLINNIPSYLDSANQWLTNLVDYNELFSIPEVKDYVQQAVPKMLEGMTALLRELPQALVDMLQLTLNSLVNWIIGLVCSIYIILYRHRMTALVKEFLREIMRRSRATGLIAFLERTDQIFARYIGYKLIEALIVALICFLGLLILQVPYAVLLGVIVGLFNLIPYFGAVVSGALALLVTWLDSPDKVLYVLFFLLALQLADGWLLAPRLYSDSMGLNPFWVIFSISVGGGLFSMLGMFLAVPVMAMIQYLLKRLMAGLRLRRGLATARAEQAKPPDETGPPEDGQAGG